ncbi:hypothetical protein PG994_001730 [Apiospora phragmitis]|uniref:Uncharacterized protein n=1 Tax=Apiospora phragmitis TaxID=2905665 RepID=A0ABR1WUE3_9PEZI
MPKISRIPANDTYIDKDAYAHTISAQNIPQDYEGGGVAGKDVKVSFSVKTDYLLAALRDDVPEDWVYGQFPPPLVYSTARVPETNVAAFARSYIEHLIREADAAYHGHNGAEAWRRPFMGVTNDARAWTWRVEVGAPGTTVPPPPAWLRSSISAKNRWLAVRITSPAMWGGRDRAGFRYVKHILHSLTQALSFETPEDCGMAVSVGMGKRAFSLTELRRLAAGFFVTGHLLSTLPDQSRTLLNGQGGGGGGGCVNNTLGSVLAATLRRRQDAPNRAHPEHQLPGKLFDERRVIQWGALPKPKPMLTYLSVGSTLHFSTETREKVGELMSSSLSGRLPVYDFRHYRSGVYRAPEGGGHRKKTTVACRQLGATTDADSVAVWCDLLTSLVVTLLETDYRERLAKR